MKEKSGIKHLLSILLVIAEITAILIGTIRVFHGLYLSNKSNSQSILTSDSADGRTSSIEIIKIIWDEWIAGLKNNKDTNIEETTEVIDGVEVPDCVGYDIAEAIYYLDELGLECVEKRIYSEEYPYNAVMWQDILPNSIVDFGTVITLGVSDGEEPSAFVQVPDLFGLTLEEAESILDQQGLCVGNVIYEYSDYPTGTVISQFQTERTSKSKGDSIDLVISDGEASEKLNESGMTGDAVIDDEQIRLLASDYYYNHNGVRPPCVRIDSYDGDIVVVHLYEALSDHDVTWDWYYVDRTTGETRNFMGESFNILSDEPPVHISDDDTVITTDTFGSDDSIYVVEIGWDIHSIEDGSFSNLKNLQEIRVDKRNFYFTSFAGCLYNKDCTLLICVPQNASNLQIAPSIKSYTPHALDGLEQSQIDKLNNYLNRL